MKLFFRIILKMFLILAILIGCEFTEEIKETDSNELPNQGIALLKEGQYDRAIAFFNEALETDPRNADAYNNRGLAYYYKGQYDKAISDYTKAIAINPRYAEAYANRGRAYYYDNSQYDKAISDYTMAIEINPRYAWAYDNRGLAYYAKGDKKKTCSDWRRACELWAYVDCEGVCE